MLPLLVLRRLDAVLEPTSEAVRQRDQQLGDKPDAAKAPLLRQAAGPGVLQHLPAELRRRCWRTTRTSHKTLLRLHRTPSPPTPQEVLEEYHFDRQRSTRLDKAGILYQVLGDFADLDLHPQAVSNEAMGYIFEELLRKFSEMSNETAGEHYTPREVIRLMVDLLFARGRRGADRPGPGPHRVRPGRRHRRHADRSPSSTSGS